MKITKLKIRLYGDPCLRIKSDPIASVGPSERVLIHSLIETMHENKGVGLAAPQVGIGKRLFVIDVGDGPFALINPKIIKQSGKTVMEEGCLSIPGVAVPIERATKIKVEYIDEKNKKVKKNCTDLLARVIQHEHDHLNGRLIVDYADKELLKEVKDVLNDLMKRVKE